MTTVRIDQYGCKTTVRTIAGHRVSVSEPDEGDHTVFIGNTSTRLWGGYLSPHAIIDITQKLGKPDRVHENSLSDGSVCTLEYLIEDMPKRRKA